MKKKSSFERLVLFSFLVFTIGASAQQNTWHQKAGLIVSGRSGAVGFSIGHYGFIGCGISPSYLTDFSKWNQTTNTWSSIASYPGAAQLGCVGFSINGKGYVGLGWNGSSGQTDLWEFDTATGAWTQKASFPGVGRYGAVVFVIGNCAYVGTGSQGSSPYLEDFWKYNATTNTWSSIANYAGGFIAGAVAFSIGNFGYVGSGSTGGSNYNNSFWQYNPANDTWTAIASLPIAGAKLDQAVAFSVGSEACVGTGVNSAVTPIRSFWAYDTFSKAWNSIANLGGYSRDGSAVAMTIGNKGYVGTGLDSNGNYLSDLWEYSPGPLSVNTIKVQSADVNLYPNPSNGNITISYKGLLAEKAELLIIDIQGKVVQTTDLAGQEGKQTLDESFLPNGVYFYRMISADNTTISSGKFCIIK